jgi:hypothetical protein
VRFGENLEMLFLFESALLVFFEGVIDLYSYLSDRKSVEIVAVKGP